MSAIQESRHGAVTVIKPTGPLVQEQAQALRDAALAQARALLGRVTIDLAEAPYVDSVGLESLLDVADELDRCGQTLRLAAVSGTVREVFGLTGLTNRFEFHDDANGAVRSFL